MTYKANVSVIIPIFNQEKRLQRCLDSILSQEGVDLEIICINDGSTDGSGAILKNYACTDDRFVIIDQPNHGAGYSRNVGLGKATGEFVIFCDADDRVPDKAAYCKLYRAAKEHQLMISAGSFSLIENDALITSFDENYFLEGYTFKSDGIVDFIDYQFDYGFQRFMFNLDFLVSNNLTFPKYSRFEDPVFLVQALNLAEKFYALSDIVYEYHAGHQVYSWEKGKVLDLYKGLSDNLLFSSKENLARLHFRTLNRIEVEYEGVISPKVFDEEILESLIALGTQIDWDLLQNEGFDTYQRADSRILSPLKRMMNDYAWRVKISESNTFKIVRYITAIPRIINRKLKRRRSSL